MRLRTLPRPAALLPALLGLVLALAVVPVLASPAWAATVVVTGTVTGPDASGATVPVEDVQVEARNVDGSGLDPRAYDYTAADGTYTLTLPAAGTYRIEVQCWGDYPCADVYAPEPGITRTITTATVVDATLERWGRITGTVRKNGVATAWPAGAITAENDERLYWSSYPGVPVASNGTFTIEQVAPGTVSVTGSEPYEVENHLATVAGQTFTVAPGATTNISLLVEDWPGLYVRAVDPSGAPLEGLRWNVYSRPVGGTWDAGLQMGPLNTDADGRMSRRITDKALEYTVCFYDDVPDPSRPERRLTRCLGDAADLAGATPWKHSAAQPKMKADVTLPLPFTTVATPTISGTAEVGSTLTANPGTWVPAATTTTYQWLRSGVEIPGATASAYQLTAADAGKHVTVRVTGTRAGYGQSDETSTTTTAVGLAVFTRAPAPKVKGKAKVRSRLRAVVGTWAPTPATTTYQWYRNKKPIKGATQRAYKLRKADRRKRIRVVVTQARPGYATVSQRSARTKRIR